MLPHLNFTWPERLDLARSSFPGHDHEGMLAHLDEAAPAVLAWLDQL